MSSQTVNSAPPRATGTAPPGAPAWVTDELIADTLATWQPRYAHSLTEADALEILLTVARLFDHGERSDDEEVSGPG